MTESDTSRRQNGVGRITDGLPAGEDRPGQRQMAEAVEQAIVTGRHVVVQAGTGTGKTLAYLVPIVEAGCSAVVVTATKALQDQLHTKDLPFLARRVAELGGPDLDWAVLKGRSNYLCLQRLTEITGVGATGADDTDGQARLDVETMAPVTTAQITRLAEWAATTSTGDQAELDWTPSDTAWKSVSVGSDECPGADRCPQGSSCFAERARWAAAASDVVVVNAHLYGLHVGSGGAILPDHDVVVFDEAHVLEDVMSDTVGIEVSPGRFTALAGVLGRIIADPALLASITELGDLLRDALTPHAGARLGPPMPAELTDVLADARGRIGRALEALLAIETSDEGATQRRLRAQTTAGRLAEQLDRALAAAEGTVAFVSGRPDSPRLEIAPLDVGPTLAEHVWAGHTAVLTSATIPSSIVDRLGLPPDQVDVIDVGSPFDYEAQSLLYCAMHLPDPRDGGFRAAVQDELVELITAAGGRTLALFTSWAAMDEAATAVAGRIPHTVLTQRDLPKPALIAAFSADESTCLFATAGFFQGVDVPGRTLSLVVIDRLPFPRPDDPLLSARRERLGAAAFGQIDLPRASMMLAQASGRLIRTTDDRGVVAVLDRRLGTAGYRWDIIRSLPPMKRTKDRSEVISFLRQITE